MLLLILLIPTHCLICNVTRCGGRALPGPRADTQQTGFRRREGISTSAAGDERTDSTVLEGPRNMSVVLETVIVELLGWCWYR